MYEPSEVLPALIADIQFLRLSHNQTAALAGLPATSISRAVNGMRPLLYPEYLRVRLLLDDLKVIAAETPDRIVYWGDSNATRRLLERVRKERDAKSKTVLEAR